MTADVFLWIDQKGGRKEGATADTAETEEASISEGKRSVHDSLLLATGSGDQACYVFDVGGSQVQRTTNHPLPSALFSTFSFPWLIRLFR